MRHSRIAFIYRLHANTTMLQIICVTCVCVCVVVQYFLCCSMSARRYGWLFAFWHSSRSGRKRYHYNGKNVKVHDKDDDVDEGAKKKTQQLHYCNSAQLSSFAIEFGASFHWRRGRPNQIDYGHSVRIQRRHIWPTDDDVTHRLH